MNSYRFPARVALLYGLVSFLVPTAAAGPPVVHKEDLVYSQPDARTTLKLDLFAPKEDNGPLPTVALMHGGAWMSGERAKVFPLARKLAENGFVVVAVGYRLAQEKQFPAALHDVKAAVRWLRANHAAYRIDPVRLAAVGFSAGGHLALLAGTTSADLGLEGEGGNAKQSSALAAVVAYYPPTDLEVLYREQVTEVSTSLRRSVAELLFHGFLGGSPKHADGRYALASPITHVRKGVPPALLLHGSADALVPVDQSRRFAERMRQAGASVDLRILEGVGHGFGGGSGGVVGDEADAEVLHYLRERLKPRRAERP